MIDIEKANIEFKTELLKRNLMKPYIIKPTNEEIQEYSKNFKYHGLTKSCIICETKFSYGDNRVTICGCCKIVYQCPQCKKNKY